MALDQPVDFVHKWCGHDGSRMIEAELGDPRGRQGHHIQECIGAALSIGKTVTPVELFPVSQFYRMGLPIQYGPGDTNWVRFENFLNGNRGVLTGIGARSRCMHALACNNGYIVDPDNGEGFWYERGACEAHDFYPQCLWIIK